MNDEIRVRIDGLNLSRIVEGLISQGVLLNNLKIKSKYILFSIKQNHVKNLNIVCRKEHKNYIVISRHGICNFLSKAKYFFGVLFAFVLVSCYLISFQSTIFKVNITNETNLEYDLDKVDLVLKSNNIGVGLNKFFIKSNKIEEIVFKNLGDISKCLVTYNGLILNIKIYPEKEKHQINEDGLYSKFDGVISDIELFSGKSDLKVGDTVKSGDLLVKSDGGARANIKGKVCFSEMKLFNERQEKVEFTGKVDKIKNIYFCNKNILKQQNDISFSKYLTKKCEFYICDNYFLPIKIEEILFFEYEIKEVILDFKEFEEQIKSELYNGVMNKIPDDVEIINKSYSVVREGDYVRVDCFVEAIVDLV